MSNSVAIFSLSSSCLSCQLLSLFCGCSLTHETQLTSSFCPLCCPHILPALHHFGEVGRTAVDINQASWMGYKICDSCAFLCVGLTRGDRQPEGDMKSLTEKKELSSGKVTAKVSELPWWEWVCHHIMGNGSGWTSRRQELVRLVNQNIKAKLENKSIEIPQKPHNFYHGDDDVGLFKNHFNSKS